VKGQPFAIFEIIEGVMALMSGKTGELEVYAATPARADMDSDDGG
jgi:hypothetical protein